MDGAFASHKPFGSQALLMGFGGGGIALELISMGFDLDVVEIDSRLPGIAHDYFLLDTSGVDFYIDDARHFIRRSQEGKKYDLVVIDLLHGEVQPNHVFTVEGLTELRNLLKEDATVLVNYQSNFDEPKQPYLAILKTLWAAGYDAAVADPRDSKPSDYVFVASPKQMPESIYNDERMNGCCLSNVVVQEFRQAPIVKHRDNVPMEDLLRVPVLVDDAPILETMNRESIMEWRKSMVYYLDKGGVNVFK